MAFMELPPHGLCHAVFTTSWGPMAAVASSAGLARVILPHYQSDDLRQLVAFEHPGSVQALEAFADLIQRCRDYFNGQRPSFDEIVCDLPASRKFAGMVLRACRKIPYGHTTSYGRLSAAIGRPEAARATAGALGKNPLPLVIPCHRVTYADGRPGGFSSPAGVQLKQRMLALEAE